MAVIFIQICINAACYILSQERITFHRGTNFTLRLILDGLERSTIRDKSSKVSHAQETRFCDLYKDLVILGIS